MLPISSAPTDDSVVLTELGFMRYVKQSRFGSPLSGDGWIYCTTQGDLFYCADDGIQQQRRVHSQLLVNATMVDDC